ncbi:poly-beta-1,6-N-acetyl-D-glucosamine biosynthesis protein PgaD [Solimonas marina]|uniref:Poly-beta-1,6-N-acetyl-D-glucosamine biosynthesis protein PgaD n=1 Tax=Solimonas marina TaxID=2714601 RepID=A0A969W8H4_9GAMM|nr:poly-beta-1,6-N-acetyl-D-glucosamine biosynthesis protein PgaD [Solimonas marina]NKF22577.1 poly-beta-1,6-N-acetyl-D-glucosamine biosynthesis protein PgaD [Solimonas marina]
MKRVRTLDEIIPELIIERPERQAPLQRTLFGTLTLLAWLAYIYLWLPLLTLIAWWLALRTGLRVHVLSQAAGEIDYGVLLLTAKMVLLACVLMIGWAEYNRRRFQGRERRRPIEQIDVGASAAAFGVGDHTAQQLRTARVAVVHVGEGALVDAVEPVRDRR